MLGNTDATATIGVKDLKVARAFYEGKLGLEPADGPEQEKGVATYKSGNTTILVYESQFAGTNQATALTWVVGEQIEPVVEALKAKGITFEHYDLPGTTRHGDIHVAGNLQAAWFKDPDGNIFNIAARLHP